MRLRLLLVCAALAACVACSGANGAAASTADGITKALYNNDIDGVTSRFDDQLKRQVSRAQVGTLSDKMHALGDYKGLTLVSNDPVKNEFVYRANFDKGTANVVLRLDPDGRVRGYHVVMPG